MWTKLLIGGVFCYTVTRIISYMKSVEDDRHDNNLRRSVGDAVNDDHDNIWRLRIEYESQIDVMRRHIENQKQRIRNLEMTIGLMMKETTDPLI